MFIVLCLLFRVFENPKLKTRNPSKISIYCNYSPHKKTITTLMRIISRKDSMTAKY